MRMTKIELVQELIQDEIDGVTLFNLEEHIYNKIKGHTYDDAEAIIKNEIYKFCNSLARKGSIHYSFIDELSEFLIRITEWESVH